MMTIGSIALTAGRAAVILALVLVAHRGLPRVSAATRRSMLVGGFLIVLALPIATALLPALHLRDRVVVAAPELGAGPAVPDPVDRVDVALALRAPREAAAPAPASLSADPASRLSPLVIVLAVWALGAALVLARLGVGLIRARRLVAAARFVETIDFAGRPVEIRISGSVDTPAVTGVLVPVVLLPLGAAGWTAERRRLVLAHELAHVASHDCLASVIAQLAVAIHWFDPLVWLAARRLRMERELAADDRVLEHGVRASSYAEHLLALATSDTPLGVLAMAEPSQIAVRIHALLAPRRPTWPRRARVALLGVGIALAMFVACATPEPERTQALPATPTSPSSASPAGPASPGSSASPPSATIDAAIQTLADEELARLAKDATPRDSIILVLDPHTGAVLAASHLGGRDPTAQLAANRAIMPGSAIKPLVVAAALDEGVIGRADHFDASPRSSGAIADSEPHGILDVGEILASSSNVGMAKVFDKLGGAKLAVWTQRYHLASAPPTIPDGEVGAGYATGAKLAATPLEMAGAYAALANGGVYHPPAFGTPRPAGERGERIVRADTAATVLDLLEGVTGAQGTGQAARVAGVRVAGKTGTARIGPGEHDSYATFVGAAPIDHPRYVIFVGAETSREGYTGGSVAAPVFGRMMTRLLERAR